MLDDGDACTSLSERSPAAYYSDVSNPGSTTMNATLRRATEADVPDLVRLFIMATDGIVDVLYHDLVPGVPTAALFEWRFTQAGSVKSYEYCWVAQQGPRAIGMVHAYPIDRLADAPSDPRLTADRLAVLAPLGALVEQAHGSYYINAIAVIPECRSSGIGNQLMALAVSEAQQQGCAEVSLLVFEQNGRAAALYRRLGFDVVARSPIIPHPLIHHSGDLLLMMRRL
jgi:ribosomal protein S18 acetylase RimI-like enzyme